MVGASRCPVPWEQKYRMEKHPLNLIQAKKRTCTSSSSSSNSAVFSAGTWHPLQSVLAYTDQLHITRTSKLSIFATRNIFSNLTVINRRCGVDDVFLSYQARHKPRFLQRKRNVLTNIRTISCLFKYLLLFFKNK
jgi:hypothetical protein